MFKFLKRLRGKDVDASSPVEENQPAAVIEVLPGSDLPSYAPAPSETETESGTEATVAQSGTRTDEKEIAKPDLVSVELPKRSLGTGIRSLFSGAMDIDGLEDILILADLGVETAEEIAAELRGEANRQGVTTDPGLRLLLKDLLAARLSRNDSELNLDDGTLP